jgi:hypothetical protein
MSFRRISIALFAIFFFSLVHGSTLKSADLYGWVQGRYRGPVPYYMGNPKRIESAQSAPIVHPPEPSPRAYPYGYFGAQYRPYGVSSTNYYNDYNQWSFRRGY